jgi:uncharacterized RDD family membrane protein YckC
VAGNHDVEVGALNQAVSANQAVPAAAPGTHVATGHHVVTGEAVRIDLRVARLGSRTIAAIVDLFIESVALFAAFLVAVLVVQPGDDALAEAVAILVYVGIVVGYPVGSETFMRGRTVGKMVMGLRVVRDDGGPIRFRHAFTRGLLGAVVERPGFLLGLPAIISMLASNRSKRLGDIFAGTVVLQESVPRTTGVAPSMPPGLEGWAALLDLTALDDDLAFAVRRFLGRAWQMSPQARDAVGAQLVAAVGNAVTPAPPSGTPGWAYLSAVLAERTRRAYHRLVAAAQQQHPVQPPAGHTSPWPPAASQPAPGHPFAGYPFPGQPLPGQALPGQAPVPPVSPTRPPQPPPPMPGPGR